MKRIISLALALMLVFSLVAVVPAAFAAGEYTAKLGFANSDWSAQEWGDNVNTTVTGAGTYTLSWDVPAETPVTDALVFVVDIEGAGAENYNVTGVTVSVDGTELPVDLTKVVTGDLEEKGNYRIELYNEYGSTKADPAVDNTAVKAATNLTVTFTLEEGLPAGSYDATLGFANSDWSVQEWGDNAKTVVSGAGTYSVSWDIPAETPVNDALVFVVDVVGGGLEGYVLDALTLTLDGTELPVDLSKVVTGDIEEKGNFRIELYNEYGTTKENAPLDNTAVKAATNLTVTFTLSVDPSTIATEPKETEPPTPKATFDPAGKYNAYLGVQTPNWTYRDAWNSPNGIGSDYWGDFIYGNETKEKYGKVTDAEVAGNGTYTVSVTDFGTIFADDFVTGKQDYFNLLYISTDIPRSDDVKVTDVKLIVDGKTVHTYREAYLDPDDTDYVKILIQNIWNEDVKEISYYAAPTTKLEMQFTISGFNYDAAGAEEPTQAPTEAPTPTEPAKTETKGGSNVVPIVIAVVVVVVAVVAVVVIKKKEN